MEIKRYSDKPESSICIRRDVTRMIFPSKRWVEIVRYVYPDQTVIVAYGSTPENFASWSWGYLHKFDSFDNN